MHSESWVSKRKLKLHKHFSARNYIMYAVYAISLFIAVVYSGKVYKLLFSSPFVTPLPASFSLSPNIRIDSFEAKQVELLLARYRIDFVSVHYQKDKTYTVFLKNGGEVILSSKKDLTSQVSSLQLLINRLTIEGKSFKRLDLRFTNPVIVLNPQK